MARIQRMGVTGADDDIKDLRGPHRFSPSQPAFHLLWRPTVYRPNDEGPRRNEEKTR